ncbi:MAG: phosphoribosylformylglycinamidine synthase subunit PurQ [Polyangiaceae bacterium]|nr:phosphoribosylformylglycinamidine synthase subunit PurQ [Polyangiaceae bacterium]
MHATVVVFPGLNADVELIRTLRDVVKVSTSVAWHRDAELPAGTDLCAIPGGFSYGDYLRCGAIARASPILAAIRRHAERGGYVLGICNGFQILTEANILPGALTRNAHMRFECRDIFLTPSADGPFTRGLPRVLKMPIAHAEGRYQASPATLTALAEKGGVALRYCDRDGNITPASNPNGSIDNIAGIQAGPKKNVLGLMPHPERMSEALLGGDDGRALFEAVVRSAAGGAA